MVVSMTRTDHSPLSSRFRYPLATSTRVVVLTALLVLASLLSTGAQSASAITPIPSPLLRFSAAVHNASTTQAGTYRLATPDSTVRDVTWRGSEITYVATTGGAEFGWAYANGQRYDRWSGRLRPGIPAISSALWFSKGYSQPAAANTRMSTYPQIIARAIATDATSVSLRGTTWTVKGFVRTDVYTSGRSVTSVVRFDNRGNITQITSGGLSMTVATTAPTPLVRSDQVVGSST